MQVNHHFELFHQSACVGEATKSCGKCHEQLPLSLFNKSSRHATGRQNFCRSCQREASHERRVKRKQKLAIQGIGVEAKTCRACGTSRSAEHFARLPGTKSGLDDVCHHCRPILARERGIGADEAVPQLSHEERKACALMRDAARQARRLKVATKLDWDWFVDRLVIGICELTGLQLDIAPKPRKKSRRPVLKLLDAAAGFVAGNCILVAAEAA